MDAIESLIINARRRGFEVNVSNDLGSLNVKGPRDRNGEIVRELAERKDEVIVYLTKVDDEPLATVQSHNGNSHTRNANRSTEVSFRRFTAAELDAAEFNIEY